VSWQTNVERGVIMQNNNGKEKRGKGASSAFKLKEGKKGDRGRKKNRPGGPTKKGSQHQYLNWGNLCLPAGKRKGKAGKGEREGGRKSDGRPLTKYTNR